MSVYKWLSFCEDGKSVFFNKGLNECRPRTTICVLKLPASPTLCSCVLFSYSCGVNSPLQQGLLPLSDQCWGGHWELWAGSLYSFAFPAIELGAEAVTDWLALQLEAWHLIELCAFLRALHASQNRYYCASSAPIMFSFLQQPNQLKTCTWKNKRLCYYLQLHKPRCSITYTEARPVCWEVTQMLFCRAALGKAQKEATWNTHVEVQDGLVVLKCNNRRLNQWN